MGGGGGGLQLGEWIAQLVIHCKRVFQLIVIGVKIGDVQ